MSYRKWRCKRVKEILTVESDSYPSAIQQTIIRREGMLFLKTNGIPFKVMSIIVG